MQVDAIARPSTFNPTQPSSFFSPSQRDNRYRHQQGGGSGGVPINKNIIPVSLASHHSSKAPVPPAYEPARPDMDLDPFTGEEALTPQASETLAEYTPSPIVPVASSQPSIQQQASVLVTHLPWRLNNHLRLHEHFGNHGTVVNVVTNFGNQNSQALVTFSSPLEAEAAYRSPEPILSNRFIRLQLWPINSNGNGFPHRLSGSQLSGRFRGRNDFHGLNHQNQVSCSF